MDSSLSEKVSAHIWHHSIDLGSGVITPGGKSEGRCKAEAEAIFGRVNLQQCSVLDIGAWNGYFSFEAKKRGAGRVLATDSFCWTHPRFRGRETFELARSALDCDVETLEIDPAALSEAKLGQFDVVLFLGVFYHRYDATEILARIAPMARHLLVVETHLALRDRKEPAMEFFPGAELNDDGTNWWAPNEFCMEALLLGQGFSEVEMSVADAADVNRGIFHAWRSTSLRTQMLQDQHKLKPLRPRFLRRVADAVIGSGRRMRP